MFRTSDETEFEMKQSNSNEISEKLKRLKTIRQKWKLRFHSNVKQIRKIVFQTFFWQYFLDVHTSILFSRSLWRFFCIRRKWTFDFIVEFCLMSCKRDLRRTCCCQNWWKCRLWWTIEFCERSKRKRLKWKTEFECRKFHIKFCNLCKKLHTISEWEKLIITFRRKK